MKLGLRTPSIKKSLSARTTGKLKRSVKKMMILFLFQSDLNREYFLEEL